MPDNTLAKLRIQADKAYLAAALEFTRTMLASQGLPADQVEKLVLVTEEASVNVIDHAFDPDETGAFDIEVARRPGEVVVAVADKGLPFDFSKVRPGDEEGVGMRLMRAFADEVRFLNMGVEGKRVEFVKHLPAQDIAEITEQKELPTVSTDAEIIYRQMTVEDVTPVARCVYRSYGYTYGNDFVYYPALLKDKIENDLVKSVVAECDGEIVGHLALVFEEAGGKVAESGMAVVDPRFRGHGVFKNLKRHLLDLARKLGMYGVYSDAVAVHPYTQKGNLSLGAHETGLVFGLLPTTQYFRNIYQEKKSRRQSAVLFYLKLQDGPDHVVYPPMHHRSVIARIYEEGGLKRELRGVEAGRRAPADSDVQVATAHAAAMSFIRVRRIGRDLADIIRYRLRELCRQKIDVIYLDLPLADPGVIAAAPAIEMLGFFFAGVVPELHSGDVLRLQYLNNIEPELEKVTRVSPFCNELFDYIVANYEKELEL